MNNEDNIYPVEVFAGSAIDAGMVKSLLENAEIEVFVRNDALQPWNFIAVGSSAVKLVVANKDYLKAKEVVEEYLRQINEE